jgi:hypothetical protein
LYRLWIERRSVTVVATDTVKSKEMVRERSGERDGPGWSRKGPR